MPEQANHVAHSSLEEDEGELPERYIFAVAVRQPFVDKGTYMQATATSTKARMQ